MAPLSCEPLLPNDSDALPRYQHATPSGPWPWMGFNTVDNTTATTGIHTRVDDWEGYPRNLFWNWTPDQVERSQILKICSKNEYSTIYWMDVLDNAKFTTPDMSQKGHTSPAMATKENEFCEDGYISTVTTTSQDMFWAMLQAQRSGNIRVRSLFVDNLSSPVLRMLGTSYNVEPFFFTSSIHWIPSRYQEAFSHGKGDHITITLPFIRTVLQGPEPRSFTSPTPSRLIPTDNHIDSQAPLPVQDGHILCMDLLAIHMVRDAKTSTIISYHPESTGSWTSAKRLHSLMMLVGDSAYWQNIFSKSKDPTFLFLAILWYPLYAWDESFESLHSHVSSLASRAHAGSKLLLKYIQVPDILKSPADHSCYLQALQARLLHYESLLDGYQASVSFIEKTPNPAMESQGIFEAQRKASNELMKKECANLLSEIGRLEKRRRMLKDRLTNLLEIVNRSQMKALIEVTDRSSATLTKILDSTNKLTDATVRDLAAMRQILDSTNKLTDATVRDLAAMRQSSYLTMIFLPASFIASIFLINVKDVNGSSSLKTLCDITLAVLIVYIVVTLQTHISTRKVANSGSVVNPFP